MTARYIKNDFINIKKTRGRKGNESELTVLNASENNLKNVNVSIPLGKFVAITGVSGAGKSTLINKFDKSLNIETKPISDALNRGVHTTRHTEIYKIGHIYLVDTPGFSALDLKDISISDLKNTFKEFNNYSCAYKDCTHDAEKGCGVKIALENGKILLTRYQNYLRFLKEVYESSSKLYK